MSAREWNWLVILGIACEGVNIRYENVDNDPYSGHNSRIKEDEETSHCNGAGDAEKSHATYPLIFFLCRWWGLPVACLARLGAVDLMVVHVLHYRRRSVIHLVLICINPW
jgi:hypothetical protein